MSNEQQEKAVEQAPANQQMQVSNTPEFANLLARSESKDLDKKKAIFSINMGTFQLDKPGDSFRGLFYGIGTMTVTNKATGELTDLPAVQLVKDRKIWMNAGANLVGTLKGVNPAQGTAIEIVLKEINKDNVKIYDVNVLA